MYKTFTKNMLKTGMRVETRDGTIYTVIKDMNTLYYGHQDIVFIGKNSFVIGDNYDDHLTLLRSIEQNNNFDIVAVYEGCSASNTEYLFNHICLGYLLWEKEEEVIFNHTAHKEQWNWLAENPDKEKCNWPGWKGNGGEYSSSHFCFACQYYDKIEAKQKCNEQSRCVNHCPIFIDYCGNREGLHDRWKNENNLQIKSAIAKIIANLPVKEGIKYI